MRVLVGDTHLFFDVEGAGWVVEGPTLKRRPTLLLLSGGPGFDHTVFKPSFSQLGEVAQVVYLDFRGHGRSDFDDPKNWTLAVFADDVRMFCDALGIDHPVVLGWSFGGMVAMAYAARHPDHPAKLILQSTMARLDVDRVAEGFRRVGGDDAAKIAYRYWSGRASSDVLTAYIEACGPLYSRSKADPEAAARAKFNLDLISDPGSVMRGINLVAELASVDCPTLVLVGDKDPMSMGDTTDEIVAALPKPLVTVEHFSGAGHHIHRDDPTHYFPVVRAFLQN